MPDPDLLADPRPNLSDSCHWWQLFRLIYDEKTIVWSDKNRAVNLHEMLYMIRSEGAVIRQTLHETKIEPLLAPSGGWESKQEFDEIAVKHLMPYKDELKLLLRNLGRKADIA